MEWEHFVFSYICGDVDPIFRVGLLPLPRFLCALSLNEGSYSSLGHRWYTNARVIRAGFMLVQTG